MDRMAGVRTSIAIALVVAATSPRPAPAALNYSSIGSTYNQSFDGLVNSGTDVGWTNDATLAGWHLYRVPTSASLSPAVAIDLYDAGDGSSDSGRFYSFGAASSSERALGAIGSGSLASFGGSGILGNGALIGWIAVALTNNTGSELSQFTANFAGEQWRDAGNDPAAAQTMTFEYGYGSSFDGVTTWNSPGGSFDWSSPVQTSLVGEAVNGNTAGRIAGLGGTIAGQGWTDGTTLWLRWVERNDSGLDHGLAVDDFSFTATTNAIPEPGAVLFGGVVCVVIGLARAGRRLLARVHMRG